MCLPAMDKELHRPALARVLRAETPTAAGGASNKRGGCVPPQGKRANQTELRLDIVERQHQNVNTTKQAPNLA